MKKWTIIAACAVVCFILIVFATLWNLGTIIKKSINTYGPRIVHAEVHVESVRTVLSRGEAHLTNFYLGNPAGFKTPHAIKASSIYLDLNEASLAGNTIVIDRIELIHPEINYEKIRGNDNFRQLVKNINGSDGTPEKADRAVKENGGKRLIIRDVIFRNAEVTLAISGRIGHRVSARLQDIHLRDIGAQEGGLPPSEAFKILLSALYSNITTPQTIIEDLSRDTGREFKNATGRLKKLWGR